VGVGACCGAASRTHRLHLLPHRFAQPVEAPFRKCGVRLARYERSVASSIRTADNHSLRELDAPRVDASSTESCGALGLRQWGTIWGFRRQRFPPQALRCVVGVPISTLRAAAVSRRALSKQDIVLMHRMRRDIRRLCAAPRIGRTALKGCWVLDTRRQATR
jgi:hypothetical protein